MDIKKFNMKKTYQTCRLIKNRVDLYLYEMAILFANLLAPVIDHMVVMSNIKRRRALNNE